MEIIKTTKLTKYYGKARGIIDLDLTVAQGEFFGFIGPNGAGKSTTIRTLLGLISPTSGSAAIFGKDVTNEKESILQDIGSLGSIILPRNEGERYIEAVRQFAKKRLPDRIKITL